MNVTWELVAVSAERVRCMRWVSGFEEEVSERESNDERESVRRRNLPLWGS